jgi:hypothetical protein
MQHAARANQKETPMSDLSDCISPGPQQSEPPPFDPTPVIPDGRTAETWRISWSQIHTRDALDHVRHAIADMDEGDIQALALLERAAERLEAGLRRLAREAARHALPAAAE